MSTQTEEHHAGHRERRRHKGASVKSSQQKTRAPDKRKLDKDVALNLKAIQEKEASMKLISWNPTQDLNADIAKLASELTEAEGVRKANTTEVERLEEELQSLGAEVIKKKDNASKLIAGVRHKSEERIDEAVSKLELQLKMRRFSAPEERKLQQEIDALNSSKDRLRAYLQLKSDIDEMRNKQDSLRKRRDSLYRSKGDLRERESSLKDLIAEKKTNRDQLKEKRKEALARKDAIEKEISDLKQQRRDLYDDFRQRQILHSQVASEERLQREMEEKKEIEDRRAARQRRHAIDREMQRGLQYEEEKSVCNALIAYVQKLSLSSHTTENSSPGPSSPSLSRPTNDQATGGVTTVSDKPGEFLRRKGDEGGVLVPATMRKRSRRDKKRHTFTAKVGKRLNHNATTFSQFSYIGLDPPTSISDIDHILIQLQEKLTFYTSKSQSGLIAGSEAGDSGVGTVCSEFPDFSDQDIATPLTNSQEDVSSDYPLSPRRSLTDSGNSLKTSLPNRSLTDETAVLAKGLLDVVSHPSSNSLRTQSSSNSTSSNSVAMATTNGIEE